MQNGYSVMGFCESGELIPTPHGNTSNTKEILQLETEKLSLKWKMCFVNWNISLVCIFQLKLVKYNLIVYGKAEECYILF